MTMGPKNNLTIRLSESVVFLRGSVESTVSGRRSNRDAQPAMLRGLLTLTGLARGCVSCHDLLYMRVGFSSWAMLHLARYLSRNRFSAT